MTNEIGRKYDGGKMQAALLIDDFPRALAAIAVVATYGAEKYSPSNWLTVDDGVNRYKNAKVRHLLAGAVQATDAESGLLHSAHEIWNALAVLELHLRQSEALRQGAG